LTDEIIKPRIASHGYVGV
jgi:hypothetical protein